jgi:hypothetical protein
MASLRTIAFASTLVLARLATASPVAQDWSKPADGVRARLVVTPTTDDKHRKQYEITLEVENASDTDGGIPMSWGYVGDMLALELVDDAGKVVEHTGIGGSHASSGPYIVKLPNDSMLRVTVTKQAIEYVDDKHAMLRPLTFQAWDWPAKHGKLFLRAKLSPHPRDKPATKPEPREWTTPLELPKVALP